MNITKEKVELSCLEYFGKVVCFYYRTGLACSIFLTLQMMLWFLLQIVLHMRPSQNYAFMSWSVKNYFDLCEAEGYILQFLVYCHVCSTCTGVIFLGWVFFLLFILFCFPLPCSLFWEGWKKPTEALWCEDLLKLVFSVTIAGLSVCRFGKNDGVT